MQHEKRHAAIGGAILLFASLGVVYTALFALVGAIAVASWIGGLL